MCGIFALLNYFTVYNNDTIEREFMKGKNRGPEFSKLDFPQNNTAFGFHRLAINGLNTESNQPFYIDNIVLICNGEIYNYKELYKQMNITPKTDSDCEVIIYLYKKYGIEQTLTMLDGVFAFILYDKDTNKLSVARDPIGVRPLYKLTYNYNCKDNDSENDSENDEISPLLISGFASDLKCLSYFKETNRSSVQQFCPGTYSVYKFHSNNRWTQVIFNTPYYLPTFSYIIPLDNGWENLSIVRNIYNYLKNSVEKRCKTTERPVACLLSGGLDSSIIAGLVAEYFRENGKKIETYSIGLEGSEDIKYAKMVAEHIGSIHHEIIVTEDDMFNAIPEVIKAIESYDTTTVRASIGNYLIGKYIAANSDAKVIFNGDGSDELFGGYLYMNKCPDDIEFDKETRRLLKDIHMFDVLRSDKSISSNGLEPRTPFLDRSLVNYVLSIPANLRNHNSITSENKCEKYILRMAINNNNKNLLPHNVLWRRKEAFSDGVSSQGRSLFVVLQEKIHQHCYKVQKEKTFILNNEYADEFFKKQLLDKPSIELEKKYYREIFYKLYPGCSNIIPYFWMPKYTNATDPSARTLTIY